MDRDDLLAGRTAPGWLRTLPHYFRASTLRLLARDLYYRLPLPLRLKWALRNTVIRHLRRRRSSSGAAGELAFGPWSAALADESSF